MIFMNLVISNDFKLFKTNKQSNVLIGSWCLLDKKIKENFDKNKDKISAYHWDDKVKISKDIKNLTKIYDYFLKQLAARLNDFHKKNYDLKFWEFIIGKWIRYYVSFLFDRWEQMSYVLKNFKIDEVQLIRFDEKKFIKANFSDFMYMAHTDSSWNHWIFAEMIHSERKLNIAYVKNEDKVIIKDIDKIKKNKFIFKVKENFLVNLFNRFFLKFIFNQNLLIHSLYLPKSYKYKLLLKYNKFITKFNFNRKYEKNVNIELRKKIFNNIKGFDKFTNFVSSLIYLHMPCTYFENFKELSAEVENSILPKKPKIIFTSNGYDDDDFFKIYCIKKKINGAKIIALQHGGSIFTNENSIDDIYIAELSDKYLTWGLSPILNKSIPLFISTVIKKKINKNFFNKGLLISHFNAHPFPTSYNTKVRHHSDIISYQNRIINFLKNVDKKILFSSVIKERKEFLEAFSTNEAVSYEKLNPGHIKKNLPEINFINTKKKIWEISKRYRIVVETISSTGFLEAMYLNIPIILLLDRKVDRFKPEHKHYYDNLEKVNILHYNPEDAAKFINSIYDNPSKWWNDKNTQKTREQYCSKFAMDKKKPYTELTNILDNILYTV